MATAVAVQMVTVVSAHDVRLQALLNEVVAELVLGEAGVADRGDRAGQLHGRVALRRLEHALQHGGCLLVLADRVHVVQVDRVVQEAALIVREVLQAEEEEAVGGEEEEEEEIKVYWGATFIQIPEEAEAYDSIFAEDGEEEEEENGD